MAGRPVSLDQWAEVSFFYDPDTVGCTPQISWLEEPGTGRWIAYAIWAGPIRKVGWKRDLVEIWELACAEDCHLQSLRALLQPACAAALEGNGQIAWWAVPDHALTERMKALGFEEQPRRLCVLGRILDPAQVIRNRFREIGMSAPECIRAANGRVELHLDGGQVEMEEDSATRMLFGRSPASLAHQQGLLTIRPQPKTQTILESLDRAFPWVRWSYFASEFI